MEPRDYSSGLSFLVTVVLLCGTLPVKSDVTAGSHVTVRRQSEASVNGTKAANLETESTKFQRGTYSENKYRPVFNKCQPAFLKEGEVINAVVTVIEAYDNDTGPAGEILFTIVRASNSEKQFEVDPVTGTVTSSKTFDRDEPAREKAAYVTVKATDGGTPPLEALCTFNVTIIDINDNPPMFDKAAYEESIPRDMEPNKTIMRIAATDVDFGENARTLYSLKAENPDDDGYFAVDQYTGVITLKKELNHNEGYRFFLKASAADNGTEPQSSEVDVFITVTSSKIKPPQFTLYPEGPVVTAENYTSYKTPIATLEAVSNIADPDLYFDLIKGQTQQTNSDETFKILERNNTVDILVNKPLDYETVTHYTLTLRVRNVANVATETVIEIFVTDVNDVSPAFIAVDQGSVLENLPPNTFVLKVQATDRDGTYPNNLVRYDLKDFKDLFAIDPESGDIRTLKQLDREVRKSYPLTVIAYDGAESSLTLDGKPNEVYKRFQIEVADVNDNPPHFPQEEYDVEVAENSDIGAKVAEIAALDKDSDSQLTYDITGGNIDDVFEIDRQTGFLKVREALDYESRKSFTLYVEAFDGIHRANTKVNIKILNVNDNPPLFLNSNPAEVRNIVEEKVYDEPVLKVNATDPDFDPEDPESSMKIHYSLTGLNAQYFHINEMGELFITKPLDRDPPFGRKFWSVFVVAEDELQGMRLYSNLEVIVYLEDLNDNAPFIDTTHPIVWYENQGPGRIAGLNITDHDEARNGAPFVLQMAESASPEATSSFRIEGSPTTTWSLVAVRSFDREERKEYTIPLIITDSGNPQQTGTSTLTITIGDANDNPMSDGTSSIFVYNYKGSLPDTVIGRAFVEDKDDWDLPDKVFEWKDSPSDNFILDPYGGFITMKEGTPAALYQLAIFVRDNLREEEATASVNVEVREIPEEAVHKSGSIRFNQISQQDFLFSQGERSKKDILKEFIAKYVHAEKDNVDIFTVLNWNNSGTDVRFSAHGSPYYDPVKLNGLIAEHKDELNTAVGAEIAMIGINECQDESVCEGGCTNTLSISDTPYKLFTNRSSFIGVEAKVIPQCVCSVTEYLSLPDRPCRNNGQATGDPESPCKCSESLKGPHCEGLQASFKGNGFAWYEPIPTCADGSLSLSVYATQADGLILYSGPVSSFSGSQDFFALELKEGSPIFYLDLGSGTQQIQLNDAKSIADGRVHHIEVSWNPRTILMRIDDCDIRDSRCAGSADVQGDSKYFNGNGPLQLGGTSSNLEHLGSSLGWDFIPRASGFYGCVQNITFNKKFYDLHRPGYAVNSTSTCDGVLYSSLVVPVLGVEIIIAIIACLLIILLMVLLFVFYRRRRSHETLKEFNDDIRENIINYSDEGGGEGDMTGYDLSVLRMTSNGKPYIGPNDTYEKSKEEETYKRKTNPADVPDIGTFLDENKGRVDRDPEGMPFDDLRHYAYEGEGNSNGSLSSLASGTEDGDLDFNCLSDFGPRFKKLADMYGDHSSDESEDGDPDEPSTESWC